MEASQLSVPHCREEKSSQTSLSTKGKLLSGFRGISWRPKDRKYGRVSQGAGSGKFPAALFFYCSMAARVSCFFLHICFVLFSLHMMGKMSQLKHFQSISFQKPNSKFLGERISLAELESNVHPGQSTLTRTNKVARGHL